jgi:hypothetical protein
LVPGRSLPTVAVGAVVVVVGAGARVVVVAGGQVCLVAVDEVVETACLATRSVVRGEPEERNVVAGAMLEVGPVVATGTDGRGEAADAAHPATTIKPNTAGQAGSFRIDSTTTFIDRHDES